MQLSTPYGTLQQFVWILLLFEFYLAATPTKANDLVLQKCLPKADMENITMRCGFNEVIAVQEAFFTSSVVDQCPFAFVNRSNTVEHTKGKLSCTDDIRMTLNSKCSGRSSCSLNLRKAHIHQCAGFDGWINIKYVCVQNSKLRSYCNLELSDNSGYVTNPGYPKFYPPYNCKWKIKGFPGQRIQIDILDLSLKEPRYTNKKIFNYECSDSVSIIEDNAKVATICGESKGNLIEYRSKTNELVVDFISYDFSPTRGVFFKYLLLDCPTLKPPVNGDMFRNGSFAYYSCHYDYVFEDTGQPTQTLFCEYDTYWNGSVARCVAKENITIEAYALSDQSQASLRKEELDSDLHQHDKKLLKRGIVTSIVVGSIVLAVIIVIIGILVHLRRNSVEKTPV